MSTAIPRLPGFKPRKAMPMSFLIPLALLASAWSAAAAAPRLKYFTFGPMLHWNFQAGRFLSFSYGFEGAWWSYEEGQGGSLLGEEPDIEDPRKPGYGMAFGMDVGRSGYRVYLEPEIGWALAGFSLGPVLGAASAEGPLRWGVQGSVWANFLAGADYRYRRLGGEGTEAVGLYGKMIIPASGR